MTPLSTTKSSPPVREQKFDWPVCSDAAAFLQSRIDGFVARHSFTRQLAARLSRETGTLLIDWIDHVVLSSDQEFGLRAAGFVEDPRSAAPPFQRVFYHAEALLPRILVDASVARREIAARIALRPDSVADFQFIHGLTGPIEGDAFAQFRRLSIAEENGLALEAIERRGYCGFMPAPDRTGRLEAYLRAAELWLTRPREVDDDRRGFAEAHGLLDQVIEMVGRDLACHLVFAGERAHWQRRNRAAQVQKERQDRLGLGWANHDHHTFRSSRHHFIDLMSALDKLGFERRERYYAGAEAGWGAQILEHPIEGIVCFCDVDLEPEEIEIDFSRERLAPSRKRATIGLWVGLHGESFLGAGMHHLECRFDYELLRGQLAACNVAMMPPFSDFPFLKQAFTEGERWPVPRGRLERLRRDGAIDEKELARFLQEGAIGSHLENLQRWGGFKGFNQKSVSAILAATDPRAAPEAPS